MIAISPNYGLRAMGSSLLSAALGRCASPGC